MQLIVFNKFHKKKLFIISVILIFVGKNHVYGQKQYELEKVVIKEDTNNTVIAIGKEKLQIYNSESISDALSQFTPAFIKHYGSGSPSSISIRSSSPSQTSILWNNIKINSALYGIADLSLIPTFFTSSIKIYRGPSSLNYGAGGLAGSVVISNIEYIPKGFFLKYIQQIGSFYTLGEFIELSYKKKSIQTSLKFYNKYSKNDFYYENRSILDKNNKHPIVKNKKASYNILGALHNITYNINSFNVISNSLWINSADRSIPDNALILQEDDGKNFAKQNDTQIRNAFNYRFYKNSIELLSFLTIDYQTLNFYSQKYVLGAPLIIDINSHAKTRAIKTGLQINNIDIGKKLVLYNALSYTNNYGLNINKLKKESIPTSINEIENITKLKIKYNNQISSLFIIDNIYRNKHYLLYYAGLNYLLWPAYSLFLNLSIGSQLRFPTINDLYFSPGGNPNLLPERNNTIESSVSLQIKNLDISVSLYNTRTNNWILWLPKNPIYWEPCNIGIVQSQGMELFLNYNKNIKDILIAFGSSFNYSAVIKNYVNSLSQDKQLPYMPKLAANFHITTGYKNVQFRWLFMGYSKRYISLDKTTSRDILQPYFINNIIISHKINVNKINILLEIKVLNLFNKNYYAVEYMPMPGRNYSVSINTFL